MSERLSSVTPMLSYPDVAAAADWLVRAFGFRETLRLTDANGAVDHVSLSIGDGVVMLGCPSPDYEGPRDHAERCETARRWRQSPYVVDGVHVVVEDVDAHHRRAAAAGAVVLSEPEDTPYGERHYRVEDLAGHRWMFAQPSEPSPS
jgi:uncharacterized glyoxalase superfamily protein PhnB